MRARAHVRLRFDAHRKGAEPDPSAVDLVGVACLRRPLPHEIVGEIVAIVFGLESDEVAVGEPPKDLLVVWQSL